MKQILQNKVALEKLIHKLISQLTNLIASINAESKFIIAPSNRYLKYQLLLKYQQKLFYLKTADDRNALAKELNSSLHFFQQANIHLEQIQDYLKKLSIDFIYSNNIGETDSSIASYQPAKQLEALSIYSSSSSNSLKLEDEVVSTHEKPITDKHWQDLKSVGYSENEIQSLITLGANAYVLEKLANNHLKLSMEDSLACLASCIRMGAESAQLNDSRNIIFVLGDTGAGKSTSINYFNGCTFEKTNKGKIHLSAQTPIKPIAHSSHARLSKTFIPAVLKSNEMIFCDCPGFMDNRGSEINISNIVNILSIMKQAKKIGLLIVINYQSLLVNRGQALERLSRTLNYLFTTAMKHFSTNILIGITKVPKIIDGESISLEDVRHELFESSSLDNSFWERTFILDIAGNEQHSRVSRADWLNMLDELPGITPDILTPDAALADPDKLYLNKVSAKLANDIWLRLSQQQLDVAINLFKLLKAINRIQHPLVNSCYQNSLVAIKNFVEQLQHEIFIHANNSQYGVAERKLEQLDKIVKCFCQEIPELKKINSSANSQLITKRNDDVIKNVEIKINKILEVFHNYATEQKILPQLIVKYWSKQRYKSDTADINIAQECLSLCKDIPLLNQPVNDLLQALKTTQLSPNFNPKEMNKIILQFARQLFDKSFYIVASQQEKQLDELQLIIKEHSFYLSKHLQTSEARYRKSLNNILSECEKKVSLQRLSNIFYQLIKFPHLRSSATILLCSLKLHQREETSKANFEVVIPLYNKISLQLLQFHKENQTYIENREKALIAQKKQKELVEMRKRKLEEKIGMGETNLNSMKISNTQLIESIKMAQEKKLELKRNQNALFERRDQHLEKIAECTFQKEREKAENEAKKIIYAIKQERLTRLKKELAEKKQEVLAKQAELKRKRMSQADLTSQKQNLTQKTIKLEASLESYQSKLNNQNNKILAMKKKIRQKNQEVTELKSKCSRQKTARYKR